MKTRSIIKGLLLALLAIVAVFIIVDPNGLKLVADLLIGTSDPNVSTAMASPLVITFAKDIQENLYPDNAWYKNSKDDSMWIDSKTVRLPQAGAPPNVERNRSVLPAQIKQREDTAEEYDIDEFTTDPIYISDTEEMQLSFAKRQSVLSDHTNTLNTNIADNFGQIWLPTLATNFVRTSGGSVAATAPSATGNRKEIADKDLIAAVTLMDRMNVPTEGRFMAIPTSMYAQLLAIDKFVDYQKRGLVDLVKKGLIGEIYGMQIYKRSYLAMYDNTGVPVKKAFGAAAAASDNEAVLIWQKEMVRRAEGTVKVYSDIDKPEYYGSIFSAKVNAGGRIARADQKGVVAIIQSHA
jgi:hypothetical protein